MKKLLIILAAIILPPLVMFLCVAFVAAEPNPMLWSMDARFGLALISTMLSTFLTFVLSIKL